MAAKVVCVSQENWAVIEEFLSECEEGAIVIPPHVQKEIENLGVESDQGVIEYDFGGEADLLIDVVRNANHYLAIMSDQPEEQE